MGRGQVLGTLDDLQRVGRAEWGRSSSRCQRPRSRRSSRSAHSSTASGRPTTWSRASTTSCRTTCESRTSTPSRSSRGERSESLLSLATKRSFDILVASLVLALTLPAFAVFAALIKRESAGPVFGSIGSGLWPPFEMIKFRTMHIDECGDAVAPKNENDPRVTRFGRWLRRYSSMSCPTSSTCCAGR